MHSTPVGAGGRRVACRRSSALRPIACKAGSYAQEALRFSRVAATHGLTKLPRQTLVDRLTDRPFGLAGTHEPPFPRNPGSQLIEQRQLTDADECKLCRLEHGLLQQQFGCGLGHVGVTYARLRRCIGDAQAFVFRRQNIDRVESGAIEERVASTAAIPLSRLVRASAIESRNASWASVSLAIGSRNAALSGDGIQDAAGFRGVRLDAEAVAGGRSGTQVIGNSGETEAWNPSTSRSRLPCWSR